MPPFEQFPQEPWYPCQWRAGDGTVCRVVVSRTSLPEHLSTHGIKNIPCNQHLKCYWLGCQAKPMHRGNILRHIRGVHLSQRQRPPKRVQESLTSEEVGHPPVGFCEWYNQDGTRTTCGEVLTRETLTLHLRKHGIKNMNRSDRTTCLWIGCEKVVNRECIVRHIRGVHLGLKRPSTQVQQHYF
ncbi:hypothetical protein JVT61DRAFT_803 [Boletus reticuloceps]|uniref:C2H2-type domain-containing protein n=1 Tax=Boletus reticuloceps TaxID=495285 RepID=A0A8I3AFZ7_9AGAM|nr:hypothetical protein JVT61DRAFT_803 [Boletus reticuloceps]